MDAPLHRRSPVFLAKTSTTFEECQKHATAYFIDSDGNPGGRMKVKRLKEQEAAGLAALPPHASIRSVPLQKSEGATIGRSAAMELVRLGYYEGKVKGGRLRSIQEVDTRTTNRFDPTFWQGRACMRIFSDGCTNQRKVDYGKALTRSAAYSRVRR
jgi:hypothetical protein